MLTVDILRSYINNSLYCTTTEAHIPEAAIGLRNSAHLQWRQALLRPHVSPSLWQGRCRRDLKNLSFATQWSMGRLSQNLEMIQWVARRSFKFLKRCHALGESIGRSVNMRKRTKNIRPVGTPYTGVCHLLAQNVMVRVRVRTYSKHAYEEARHLLYNF